MREGNCGDVRRWDQVVIVGQTGGKHYGVYPMFEETIHVL